jgi:hypothetical protein
VHGSVRDDRVARLVIVPVGKMPTFRERTAGLHLDVPPVNVLRRATMSLCSPMGDEI